MLESDWGVEFDRQNFCEDMGTERGREASIEAGWEVINLGRGTGVSVLEMLAVWRWSIRSGG